MKKSKIIFFCLFAVLYLFIGLSMCQAAWNLNASYPKLPLAPTITSDSRLPAYILYFFAFGIYVAGLIAVLSLVVGGIQLILSAESPERANSAKDRIRGALVGLVLLLAATVLLQTINPQLRELGLTLKKEESRGLWFKGNGTSGAPNSAGSSDLYAGKFNKLYWPENINTLNGQVSNCDKAIYGYMVYVYKGANYTGDWQPYEIFCGKGEADLTGSGSYLAVAEYPGVYFYAGDENCWPSAADISQNVPQSAHTSPIPKLDTYWFNSNMRCVRIINGPDKNGPFYGVALFKKKSYQGTVLMVDFGLLPGEHKSGPIKSIFGMGTNTAVSLKNFASAAIYQKAGYNPDGSPANGGAGVTLIYSGRNKEHAGDGKYCPEKHPDNCIISGADIGNQIQKTPLNKLKISYSGNLNKDEQDSCPLFDSSATQSGRKDCFQTMNIDGNFLVILSENEIMNEGQSVSSRFGYAEAFPQEKDPGGPPDLRTTYMETTSKHIKIIPLAKPFVTKSE